MMTRLNRVFRGMAFAALLAAPKAAFAQSDGQVSCIKDQYVLSVSAVEQLQDKAVDALDATTVKNMEEADSVGKFITVVPKEQLAGDKFKDAPAVVYDHSADLCAKMRAQRRDQLRDDQGSAIVRRIKCDCNRVLTLDATPNDSMYSQLWGMNQSNDIDIDAPEAWNLINDSSSVLVGVIDTGVDYNHPDLAGNLWQNPSEIPGNNIDDDRNGYVDDVYGINAISSTGNPMDDNNHGTHVSGTIGGRGNNGTGVVGVNWNAKIVHCKFLSSSGSGSLASAIKCLDYMASLKARGEPLVLSSNSWGWAGGGGANFSQPMYDAINAQRQAGLLFVAAAGNNGYSNEQNYDYPASFDLDNIISVAAVQSNGTLASFSNYGATTVDIAAPGVGIVSTTRNNTYSAFNGTSMATPHVSGALALLAAYNRSLTWQQLRDALFASVETQSLVGSVKYGGMFNLYKLLTVAGPTDPNRPTPTPRPTNTAVPTSTPTRVPTPIATPTMTPTPVPGWWDLTGLVLDGAGKPIKDAKIRLVTGSGIDLNTYTDSTGAYSFLAVQGPTSYTLYASKPNHTDQSYSAYFSASDRHYFYLYPQMVEFSVKAIDQDKKPIPGFAVNDGSRTYYASPSGVLVFEVPFGSVYNLVCNVPEHDIVSGETLSGTITGPEYRVIAAKKR